MQKVVSISHPRHNKGLVLTSKSNVNWDVLGTHSCQSRTVLIQHCGRNEPQSQHLLQCSIAPSNPKSPAFGLPRPARGFRMSASGCITHCEAQRQCRATQYRDRRTAVALWRLSPGNIFITGGLVRRMSEWNRGESYDSNAFDCSCWRVIGNERICGTSHQSEQRCITCVCDRKRQACVRRIRTLLPLTRVRSAALLSQLLCLSTASLCTAKLWLQSAWLWLSSAGLRLRQRILWRRTYHWL